MGGGVDVDVAQGRGRLVPAPHIDPPASDTLSEDVFRGGCHTGAGFSSPYDDQPVDMGQVVGSVANVEGFPLQPQVALYGSDRVDRGEGGMDQVEDVLFKAFFIQLDGIPIAILVEVSGYCQEIFSTAAAF